MRRLVGGLIKLVLFALVVGLVGGAAGWGTVKGRRERVDSYWMQAQVDTDGSVQVSEVIDYDFAAKSGKHGIHRYIPGALDDSVAVESSDAPDDVQSRSRDEQLEVRVGDPSRTVTGEHRYRIGYRLGEGEVVREEVLDWETMGHDWEVPIARAEIHLIAGHSLVEPRCFRGAAGSEAGCEIEEVEPGHVMVEVEGLAAREGVSIEARLGDELARPPAAVDPPGPISDPPDGDPWRIAGLVAGMTAASAAASGWSIRRRGRERVATARTNGADAGERRMDVKKLARLATIETTPPEGLTPAQGGIVRDETVRSRHLVAWLLDAAHQGAVEVYYDESDGGAVCLIRTGPGDEDTESILDLAFGDREEVWLVGHDGRFETAWRTLATRLDRWRRNSGLWERASLRGYRGKGRSDGVLIAGPLLGVVLAYFGALAARSWVGWVMLVVAAAVIAGFSFALGARQHLMAVRTPEGSAAWVKVESFRRFLVASKARDAEEADRRGVLDEYTAWAVALGVVDHWSDVVSTSAIPETRVQVLPPAVAANLLHWQVTHYRAALPSPARAGGGLMGSGTGSSVGSGTSGGSFGGGSVGGGGGGGGGGSW